MTDPTHLSPFNTGEAIELSRNLFRKEILSKAAIQYKGRTVKFDDQFLDSIISAFEDKAMDSVAFQLATADNRHNDDPERTRGRVKRLIKTNKGLDAVFELDERGSELIRRNPELGVSVKVKPVRREPDGKEYPRVLAHVLGTLDPVIAGMKPWQELALSNESVNDVNGSDDLVDLSLSVYEAPEAPNMSEKTDVAPEAEAVKLSKEEYAAFKQLLEERVTEEELTAAAAAELKLSKEDDELDSRLAAQEARILELSRANAKSASELVAREWAEQGLAPAIIEAAKPLFSGSDVLELSTGDEVSPAEVISKVLETVVELSKDGTAVLDMTGPAGSPEGEDSQDATAELAKAWAEEWDY